MDEEDIVDRLEKYPETYRTLLSGEYGRNTKTVITRRKLLRLVRRGVVGRMHLNGSRGGERLFYITDKKYHVVIASSLRKMFYYVCTSVKRVRGGGIVLSNARELVVDHWEDRGTVEVEADKVLKWF
jgi:hypothetical protein